MNGLDFVQINNLTKNYENIHQRRWQIPNLKLMICSSNFNPSKYDVHYKGALAIRRIFSLVDRITKPKFSNCPYVFKIGLFR